MSRDFQTLRVLEVRQETGGQAKTVMFDVPASLRKLFHWRPGQHVTLRLLLNGQEVRRPYSISSSPFSDEPLRITVRRVEGGLVSNHINDRVQAGDEIEVMPPFGGFCLILGEMLRRTHYFFGAGSGITPLYSMLHSVLCAEPYSVAHLIYGNKSLKTIIFKESLDELCKENPERLTVSHVLSKPSMWSGLTPWRRGIVDKAAVGAFIAENPPYAQDAQYFICGPGNMNGSVKAALMGLDVPASRIHMESYGRAVEVDDTVRGVAANARISLNGSSHSVAIAEGQTILEAARGGGLQPPFSCQSGVCGACRAKLLEGTVHMRARMALEDHEIKEGTVLTCQSVATTPKLSIVYD